jgi:hypothetical protein
VSVYCREHIRTAPEREHRWVEIIAALDVDEEGLVRFDTAKWPGERRARHTWRLVRKIVQYWRRPPGIEVDQGPRGKFHHDNIALGLEQKCQILDLVFFVLV